MVPGTQAAVRPLREHKGSDKYKVSHQLMVHPAHRIVEDSKGLARYVVRRDGKKHFGYSQA